MAELTKKARVAFIYVETALGTNTKTAVELRVRRTDEGELAFTRYVPSWNKNYKCDGPKPSMGWDTKTETVTLQVPGHCLTLDGTGNFDSKFLVKVRHPSTEDVDATKRVRIKGAFQPT